MIKMKAKVEVNRPEHLFLQNIGTPRASLFDISVSRSGSATTTTFSWLPDAGADIDAKSQTDAAPIFPQLSQNLTDVRQTICA